MITTYRRSTPAQGALRTSDGRGVQARRIASTLLVLAAIAIGVAACSRGPLHVRAIQVGRSLNSDNSVGAITTQFKPTDTIYVSVLTDARGQGTITARWTYVGRAVSEEAKRVSYNGEAATEFHMKTSGGFPAGDYRVEILLDGVSVGARDFKVTTQ